MRLRQCLTIVIFRTVAANWNRQWFDIADCLDLGLIQRIQWGLIFIWQTHTSTVVCTRIQSVWDFLKLSVNGSLPRKKKEERIQWRWWQWWWWCIRKKQITKSAYTCVKKINKINYKEFRLTVLIHTYNRQMILNLRMHIISHESVFLCICACAHAVKSCLFLDFFFSRCVWQMESGSKWHSYKATPGGDGLVNRYICGHRDWVRV